MKTPKNCDIEFDSFISLGGQCSTASSLSKYGLREFSGPFDWFVSSFEGVISTLDNNFEEFIFKQNLIVSEDNNRTFIDTKYDFIFMHDIEISGLEKEYSNIKKKYDNRIKRFLKRSQNPVCYVRTINNQKELDYITENADHIRKSITKWNSHSMIIFIALKNQEIPNNFPFTIYQTEMYRYYGSFREGLRSAFDTIPEFVNFCKSHYDTHKRIENKIFDIETEKTISFSRINLERHAVEEIRKLDMEYYESDQSYKRSDSEKRIKRLLKSPDARVRNTIFISLCDFSKITVPDDGIDVYGSGWIGHFLYDKAADILNIACFIDQNPDDKKNYYKDTPVVGIDQYLPNKGRTIVITPTYDIQKITKSLSEKPNGDTIKCVGIDYFLKDGIPYAKWKELGM